MNKQSINTITMIASLLIIIAALMESTGVTTVLRDVGILSTLRFLDIPSLVLIMGGVVFNSLISYHITDVIESVKHIGTLFLAGEHPVQQKQRVIDTVLQWDGRLQGDRRAALQQLEAETAEEVRRSMLLLIGTNYPVETVRELAGKSIESKYLHRKTQADILTAMGNAAPAFGMLGTIFGLVLMLSNFENPATLASGLSTAIMTTLYGLVFAYFLFLPLAKRVKQQAENDLIGDLMMLEGVVMIMEKRTSFYIRDAMNSFVLSQPL